MPWNDPNAVVEAILKLRAEPELRSQLGGNGHKVALRDYDWNHLSADFVKVMDQIASRLHHQTQIAERDEQAACWTAHARSQLADLQLVAYRDQMPPHLLPRRLGITLTQHLSNCRCPSTAARADSGLPRSR